MSDSNGSGPPSMPNGEMPSITDGDTQGDSQNNNSSEKDGNGQNEKAPPQSGEASGETAQTLDKNQIIVLAACRCSDTRSRISVCLQKEKLKIRGGSM